MFSYLPLTFLPVRSKFLNRFLKSLVWYPIWIFFLVCNFRFLERPYVMDRVDVGTRYPLLGCCIMLGVFVRTSHGTVSGTTIGSSPGLWGRRVGSRPASLEGPLTRVIRSLFLYLLFSFSGILKSCFTGVLLAPFLRSETETEPVRHRVNT